LPKLQRAAKRISKLSRGNAKTTEMPWAVASQFSCDDHGFFVSFVLHIADKCPFELQGEKLLV
jgi:hypothetical protein